MSVPVSKLDPNSFANFDAIVTRHIHLLLRLDFDRQVIGGHATYSLQVVADKCPESIVLDTRSVDVRSVRVGGHPAEFRLAPPHAAFGSALVVATPAAALSAPGRELEMQIEYATTEQCTAVQWLTAEQTLGKKHPYVFTQCQAIHARSLLPCQDSPSVKITYSAEVTLPAELTALMSAVKTHCTESAGASLRTFYFAQKVSIPSYLIALAAGNLAARRVGPRSSVWSEPEQLEAAAWEFADTESFIVAAEKILTPYEWGVYDLLVLPPSFPFGGMENPCLTFVTPTLLAGDRSLVDVVAHEIAHSWTGNLVSCKTFESFWLNEGWTVYLERLILRQLHGDDERLFSATIGWKALEESVEHLGASSPLTALQPKLDGIDPDDSFSSVPYEKGFNFLYYMEGLIGTDKFLGFFREYIVAFSHKSVSTAEFRAFLERWAAANGADVSAIDWETWLNRPGLPPVGGKGSPPFQSAKAAKVLALVERWREAAGSAAAPPAGTFSKADITGFSSTQTVLFLEKLSYLPSMPLAAVRALDGCYGLSAIRNSEVRFRWQMLCLKFGDATIHDAVARFVAEQGRMKFVRPLYRELCRTPEGKALARKTFAEHKNFYHPICSAQVEKDLAK